MEPIQVVWINDYKPLIVSLSNYEPKMYAAHPSTWLRMSGKGVFGTWIVTVDDYFSDQVDFQVAIVLMIITTTMSIPA